MKKENNLVKDATASVLAKVKMQNSASKKIKNEGKDFDSLLLKNLGRSVVSSGSGKVRSVLTDKDQYSKGADLSILERMEALNKKIRALNSEIKSRINK